MEKEMGTRSMGVGAQSFRRRMTFFYAATRIKE